MNISTSPVGVDTLKDVKTIVSDIYNITGMKVGIDDPIVAAALIQSYCIRQSGEDAARNLQKILNDSTQILRQNLINDAGKIIAQMKDELTEPPEKIKLKIQLSCLLLIGFGFIAGCISASLLRSPNQKPSADNVHALAAGRDFLQIIPHLDQETRTKIETEIMKIRPDKND